MRRFLMLIFATIAVSTMALTTVSRALKPAGAGGRFANHTWIVTEAANAQQMVDAIHEVGLTFATRW